MKGQLVTEGFGTFFLVLVIALVGGTAWAPVAIGSGLAALVYMGWHVSGAHYNPVVTLAVLLRGRISAGRAGAYVAAQLAGDISGGAFNPAVGLGPAIAGLAGGAGFQPGVLGYYVLAPALGSGLAVFGMQEEADRG